VDIVIANVTSTSEITITDPYTVLFGSLLVPIISVIVVSLVGVVTIRYTKKQHDRNAMMDLFKMLSNTNHKLAEDKIIEAYQNNNLMIDGILTQPFQEFAKTVWRNYTQAGVLVEKGLIPKKEYYLMFGIKTVVMHYILNQELTRRRHSTPQHYIAARFTNLAFDCFVYWSKKNHPIVDPRTSEPITLENLGERMDLQL